MPTRTLQIAKSYPPLEAKGLGSQNGWYLACSTRLSPWEEVTVGITNDNPAVGIVETKLDDSSETLPKRYLITPSLAYAGVIITSRMGYIQAEPRRIKLKEVRSWHEPSLELKNIEMTDYDYRTSDNQLLSAHEARLAKEPALYQPGFAVEAVHVVYQSLLHKTPVY